MKLVILLSILLPAVSASAEYAIDWFTIDGGGGRSSGGPFSVAGTVGQSDAGTSSGGACTLHGGFWSAIAVVQMDGAPALRIVRSGFTVTLAWTNPNLNSAAGFHLQESVSLVAPNWTDVGTPPEMVGDEKKVSLTIAPGARFYRLRSP